MKRLMSGNHAIGEAAVLSGCTCYFGYPITPQNELTEYMAKRMADVDGVFIQSESEIAAINMVLGAAVAGARAMTSSSGPGMSLKQEGISYLAADELPAVIVNIVRGGPGMGNIAPSQSDYAQATRGGGHGDYKTVVLAPGSVQELTDIVPLAFDLADKYRNPVIILGDGMLGQMMEPVDFDGLVRPPDYEKGYTLTGAKDRPPRKVHSLIFDTKLQEEHNWKLFRKFQLMEQNEVRYEDYLTDDAEMIVVAHGIGARGSRVAPRVSAGPLPGADPGTPGEGRGSGTPRGAGGPCEVSRASPSGAEGPVAARCPLALRREALVRFRRRRGRRNLRVRRIALVV